ncbi:hypothetical protein V3C41_00375 [Paenarthrobacter nicotinovorans]|uniref:Uncharacterized protein n=1 Tax=Paenarthrobacter nicotinovorans TaxID=29320 RepID=A0ABV0GLY1_PAENI
MLPTYKSKHSTTYRLKFVTPTGTESKESTITYHRPLMGQCDTTFVVNGTGAQNIDYPEGNAIRSISNAGPGVTHVVMNDSAFQSSTYRFVVRVDNNYLGEAHAGTAHYIANRDNGDGTRTLIIPTKPGERTVDVVIDNTAPGWGLSAASQVVASMTIG